jgi:hypothetical protein
MNVAGSEGCRRCGWEEGGAAVPEVADENGPEASDSDLNSDSDRSDDDSDDSDDGYYSDDTRWEDEERPCLEGIGDYEVTEMAKKGKSKGKGKKKGGKKKGGHKKGKKGKKGEKGGASAGQYQDDDGIPFHWDGACKGKNLVLSEKGLVATVISKEELELASLGAADAPAGKIGKKGKKGKKGGKKKKKGKKGKPGKKGKTGKNASAKQDIDVKDWGGRGQALRSYESIPMGIHFIELVYQKPREGFYGQYMGGSYTAGIVIGGDGSDGIISEESFSCGNGVYRSKAWWGLSDTGGIWAGGSGLIGQLKPEQMNDFGVAYGCGDRIGFAVDTPHGTLEFFLNGTPIPGAKIMNIPTLTNQFHVLASPFNMGASVALSAFNIAEPAKAEGPELASGGKEIEVASSASLVSIASQQGQSNIAWVQ